MKGYRVVIVQVVAQLVVIGVLKFSEKAWPEWETWMMDWLSCKHWFYVGICALVFAGFSLWVQVECRRRLKDKPSRKDFDFINPPGVFRHKKQGYDCCPHCFLTDKIESPMIVDYGCIRCPNCQYTV